MPPAGGGPDGVPNGGTKISNWGSVTTSVLSVKIVPVTAKSISSDPLPASQPLTIDCISAAVTASSSVHSGKDSLPLSSVLTTIGLARGNPDITKNKKGSAIAPR